jgi:PAS domain S-box-containing protein
MSESTRKTLLLVEDEAILAMNEKMQLEKYGYAVKTVNTGEKAVEAVKTMPEIDLVLMDINLGDGIDGTQAAQMILKDHDIPIVFVSSHSEREVVEKTERITSYGYVVKNSSITVLDASIKMAFRLFEANKNTRTINKKLEATFDAFPDLVFEVGLSGTFYDIHASNASLLYLTVEEHIGRTVKEILPPEAASIIMSAITEANDKGFSYGKQYQLPVSAGLRWFEISISRLESETEEPHFIYLSHDITERKKAEDAMLRSKETAEILLNIAAQIVMSFDEEGNITFLNDSGHALLGYTSPELIGKNWFDTCLPEEKKSDTKEYFERVKNGTVNISGYHENQAITKTGDRKTILWHYAVLKNGNGKFSSLFSSGKDITEQKIAEQKIQESADQFNLLLNSVTEGIYGVDEHENFTFCNDSALKLIGYEDQEQLLGRNMHWLIHGKHPDGSVYPIEDCPIAQSLIKGVAVHIDDEVFWRSDGTSFHVEYWANPHLKDGRVVGATVSFFDISECRSHLDILRKMLDTNSRMMASVIDADLNQMVLDTICTITGAKYAAFNIFDDNGLDFTTVAVHGINDKLSEIASILGFNLINKKWKHDPVRAKMIANQTVTVFSSLHELTNKVLPLGMVRVIERMFNIQEVALIKVTMNEVEVGDFTLFFQKDAKMQNMELAEILANQIGMYIVRKRHENIIKNILADKELILKEVHHRIKNNMNTISSLLSLQASSISEPTAVKALQDAGNRVQSMSVLYDQLYRSADFTELSVKQYLSALVDDVLQNFPNSGMVRVEKDLQDFNLEAKRLQPLGIIINELLTNIMKYAFKGRDSGLIVVSATNSNGHVTISVQDDGLGMPETVAFDNSTGFGLQLVEALTQQLNGTIRIERTNGTKVVLEFDE